MNGFWPWEQQWFWDMQVSDWNMVVFGLLLLVFTLDYGLGSPWWQHAIGWIVISYSISVMLLVFLILYGMVNGQRVDEFARSVVTFMLILGILGKIVILHYERQVGKAERDAERDAKRAAAHSERSHPIE